MSRFRSRLYRLPTVDDARAARGCRDAWAAAVQARPPAPVGDLHYDLPAASAPVARTRGFSEPGEDRPAGRRLRGAEALPTLAAAIDALVGLPLADVEEALIRATIARHGGSVPKAARVLAVSPSTLYRKLAAWKSGAAAPHLRS